MGLLEEEQRFLFLTYYESPGWGPCSNRWNNKRKACVFMQCKVYMTWELSEMEPGRHSEPVRLDEEVESCMQV